MCCSSGPGGTRLTRCGVVCGLAALAALSTALLGPAWLHTEEKIPLSYLSNNSPNFVSVRFKLGLFRVCPKIVKPSNLTIRLLLGGGLIVLASALSDASLELPRKYSLPSTANMQTDDNGLPQYHYGWCLQLSGLALILAKVAALLTMSGYMARFPTVEDMVRVMVPGAERKLREQRGVSSEYLIRAHQKSPGPPQTRGFNQPTKSVLAPQRVAEEGTSLLCKSAPDICASNPQAISYVDKADLSHVLPAYPDPKNTDPRYTYVDKPDANVVDSQLSGFADKEGLIDSRILSDSRQNMIAFTENKEQILGQEPRYTEFAARATEPNVVDSRLSGFAEKEGLLDSRLAGYPERNESLLDTPLGYDTRYNSLAGQTVPITLKHQNTSVSAIQSQYIYQNFGTIHSGILRVSEPGTSSSSNSSQRSMTLQNPKRKSQIAQNTFSTMECEKKKRGSGLVGKAGFYAGSAV
ncbi:uncharacterized protein LOC124948267 isoform X4 [Vespa velutina]|uniref:uncharacterized protein LOC124948267 isoform X4 n=1 Tax=Vespa velutina TaxID=202808 RepID=UPI001FB3D55C|nr:uncharacterized protein LOC124948267 isoform X4 [Vespa velutina]